MGQPPGDETRVDLDALDAVAQRLRRVALELDDSAGQRWPDPEALGHPAVGEAFAALTGRWEAAATALARDVAGAAGRLLAVRDGYAAVERDLAARARAGEVPR